MWNYSFSGCNMAGCLRHQKISRIPYRAGNKCAIAAVSWQRWPTLLQKRNSHRVGTQSFSITSHHLTYPDSYFLQLLLTIANTVALLTSHRAEVAT